MITDTTLVNMLKNSPRGSIILFNDNIMMRRRRPWHVYVSQIMSIVVTIRYRSINLSCHVYIPVLLAMVREMLPERCGRACSRARRNVSIASALLCPTSDTPFTDSNWSFVSGDKGFADFAELDEEFKASCSALSLLLSLCSRSSFDELLGILPRMELFTLFWFIAFTILDTRPFSEGLGASTGFIGGPIAFSTYFVGLCWGSTLCNI
ncbi:hypothetical protein HW555_002270 [Spodoptera exigua]|uniref:Uncharacterized protein n=1 Tax=Spodoptera exigua TaxID=7107 RepID=A0A835GNJ1_SPOEX|nr:hypothetical protein HW555_002270 [Spodoptera exigua]